MRDLLAEVSSLSPAKRALLERMLLQQPAKLSVPQTIMPRLEKVVPLSYAQERLWFLDQLAPGNPFYNINSGVRLSGILHEPALRQSLAELVRRHEVLRTRIVAVDGRAVQEILPEVKLALPLVDLSGLAATEREEIAQQISAQQVSRGFELAAGGLLRAVLLRLSEAEHWFICTLHHIVSDGWSMAVLVQEIGALYEAYEGGEPSRLAELAVQYADYAVWQREWLSGAVLEQQVSYWKEQLAGAPAVLELPADRVRSGVQSYRGGSERVELSGELRARLEELSRSEGVTLFMTLLAAWQVLLHRYTEQEQVVVGTPIAGRTRGEVEGLIGFFANTLVLRTELSGELSFRELLKRVREVCLGAYNNQDLPFEKLVEELQPERTLSYNPLVQVVFGVREAISPCIELPRLTITPYQIHSNTSKFDLTLTVDMTDAGLMCTAEYNSDLFDGSRIIRLLQHFENLLHGIATNVDQPISRLPLVSEAEQFELLRDAGCSFNSDHTLHELFERQAEESADAVAVSLGAAQLTYGELNERANQLARHLFALGVGPESRVGLLVERSLEMLVGLLGVLKAGGAYVPLDPDYPSQRVNYMLRDAEIKVLLTQKHLVGSVDAQSGPVVLLDSDWDEISRQNCDPVSSGASVENLAYIIYTSGSTGGPKGVMVTHANASRLFAATHDEFHFGPGDVWTLFHSYAFDFSVWEIWGALLYGGRLVVVPYLVSRSPSDFHDLLVSEGVTVLNQTPSAFQQLIQVDQDREADSLSLRTVIFGGEALEPRSLHPWVARREPGGPQLINMYGITETTVHVTYRPVDQNDFAGAKSPIGKPIADLRVCILDKHMQLAPVGVAGEMFVGGAGVSRGYLNRPELTAERFVAHPLSGSPGARLYRTGDLGRYANDGQIEYLGRADHQVKVRGFRIELGEIESALNAVQGVKQSVVVAREGDNNEKRLVAYIVPQPDASPGAGEMRRYLKDRLPDYMVPAAYILIDQVPLTPSGKLDRKALPDPEQATLETGDTFVAPQTLFEEILAGIWADVLGIDRVGIHDSFFDLGGDSILSIQVVARVRKSGLNLELQQLLQHQTIYEIARRLDKAEQTEVSTVPFELVSPADRNKLPKGLDDAYPVTKLQLGMLFHGQYDPGLYHDIFSFHLKVRFDLQNMQTAVARLVRRHAVLRTWFDLTTFSEPFQLVPKTANLPVTVEDLREFTAVEQETELALWMKAEHRRGFAANEPPLMRICVHLRTEETVQFTLTFHHAILDGWSVASLLTELFQDYMALLHGETLQHQLPPSASFRDFVALEQREATSEKSSRFWTSYLNDCNVTSIRRGLQPAGTAGVQRLRVAIDHQLSTSLKNLSTLAGVPVKSVLLAAHLKVVSLLSGQRDVLSGVVSNGRPEVDAGDRVLGLFLNTLPFRQKIAGGSWVDLVRAVFENELAMTAFRRYPIAQIQKAHGGQPLFDIAFNFLHFHVYEALTRFDGLELLDKQLVSKVNFALLAHFGLGVASADVELILEWDTREFRKDEIEQLGGYYTRVLEAMSTEPSSLHDASSYLPPRERRLMLEEWNSTQQNFGSPRCAHQIFEAQVQRSPEAIALVHGEQQITYEELNCRANQLAHHLRELGVGPEVTAGICVERSYELAIGVLGILKAGGAYLALDPAYPLARLEFMLEDARTQVLVTQKHLRDRLPATGAQLVCLDSDCHAISSQRRENVIAEISPDNLAYVIYTSGSTGRPKGVAMQHQPLVNLIEFQCRRLQLGAAARTLQFSSLSFDASFNEMFSAWRSGGTLILMQEELRRDPVGLLHFIREQEAERLFLPFVALQQLAEASGRERIVPSVLQAVLSTAEQMQVNQPLVQLFGKLLQCRLHNEYGPSETHVITTYSLSGSPEHWPNLPSIGKPIANSQTYILDACMNPVPMAVPGELYLGGDALARGYLNRPEITAERFVPDPFASAAGARVYRSGDLARYLPGGDIEFLGRLDHQVKLRGYRIEPGEIEAVIQYHPAVRDAIVRLQDSPPGQKRLVAYIVAQPNSTVNVADLKALLKEKLPVHMVPTAYVMMDVFPLTPSGKIDYKSLPLPDQQRPTLGEKYTAPTTPIEQLLVRLWAEVIDVDKIGVNDNFFELGGDSLLSMRVHGRLCEELGRSIPITRLFEYPTIRLLARFLANGDAATSTRLQNRGWAEKRKQALLRQRHEVRVPA
jgi:amino acid adenylation domain-containing protein